MASTVTDDAAKIYKLYDVEFVPKWFPVFYILAEEGEKPITDIAASIGHSQPSVTRIVKEMRAAGLVKENIKSADKRRNVVALTKQGRLLESKMKDQYADVDKALDGLIGEARHHLWDALEEWEFLLEQKSLLKRVQEQKKMRERKNVEIVEYVPGYAPAFRSLNEEWISTYFEMEEADYRALDNPKEYILKKGGKIFVALYKGEPLGVCALVKMKDPDYDYELAKMAVSPRAQGKNMGWLLANAVIDAARKMGASKIYLESNTILNPAINLYQKLGFRKISGRATPYKRCNIQMELNLKDY